MRGGAEGSEREQVEVGDFGGADLGGGKRSGACDCRFYKDNGSQPWSIS